MCITMGSPDERKCNRTSMPGSHSTGEKDAASGSADYRELHTMDVTHVTISRISLAGGLLSACLTRSLYSHQHTKCRSGPATWKQARPGNWVCFSRIHFPDSHRTCADTIHGCGPLTGGLIFPGGDSKAVAEEKSQHW